MAKYKVVKEINWGSGFYHDKNDNAVPVNNLAPKVGEILELGEAQTFSFPPLGSVKGFKWEFKPVSKLDSFSSQVIPLDSLELVDENLQTKSDSRETFLQKNKTNLLIVGVLVLGYLAYKKFNK